MAFRMVSGLGVERPWPLETAWLLITGKVLSSLLKGLGEILSTLSALGDTALPMLRHRLLGQDGVT